MKHTEPPRTRTSQNNSDNGQILSVESAHTLLPFLLERLSGLSRSRIKSILACGQIAVNGKETTQFDTPLSAGDRVQVSFQKKAPAFKHPLLQLVFEDEYLLVVNKAAGLLTIGTQQEKNRTAYRILGDYMKRNKSGSKIFVVHRLDKDTSGLLLFAKDVKTKEALQSNWQNLVRDRRYIAVAEGTLPEKRGVMRSALAENAIHKMYVSTDPLAKDSITHYRVLDTNGQFSLVELSLETGRKNQIRAHLEELGNPIAGDKKYGAQTNPLGRMALHAFLLDFVHPATHKGLRFETPIPALFKKAVHEK